MPRPAQPSPLNLDPLFAFGPEAPNADAKLGFLRQLRANAETAALADRILIERLELHHAALRQSERNIRQVEERLELLTAAPFFQAKFLRLEKGEGMQRALVSFNGVPRVVTVAESATAGDLRIGDSVFLGHELNVILHRDSAPRARGGETCQFMRLLPEGKLVIKAREEELIVTAADGLDPAQLRAGDKLLWERDTLLALTTIERSNGKHYFPEEKCEVTFADIGGHDEALQRVQDMLLLHLKHPVTANRFFLTPKRSLLLAGAPGVGKTMIAKAIANDLGRKLGLRVMLMAVKPGEVNNPWFGRSEEIVRERFAACRDAATANPDALVVMFWDELDAIGQARGNSHMRVHDSVLTALLAEADGFHERNVILIGATNRKEALDPALLRPGRFGDLVLDLPRPGRKAAFAILGKYLRADLPYARNGHGEDFAATRQEILESAVARIFSSGDAEGELATIVCRDNSRHIVRAPQLVSGAVLRNIATSAIERACQREANSGETDGLELADVTHAITHEFSSAARALSPANCRNHLSLPTDSEVVSVKAVERKVVNPQRFLNAA